MPINKKIPIMKFINKFLNLFIKNSMKLPLDFNEKDYLELNPDVKKAGEDPKEHFLKFGIKENRQYKINPFDAKFVRNDIIKILANYNNSSPFEKNSFDLFEGSWSTRFKDAKGNILTNCTFDGTNDSRLEWLFERINLDNLKVLELGPLEGAHTLMMENQGANVTAIEANIGAFMRCLVVKNQFNLKSDFLLGDFNKMSLASNEYDLVLAFGVLYHMVSPVELLKKISFTSRKLFLWTHYFEEDLGLWNSRLEKQLKQKKWDYKNPEIYQFDNFPIRIIKQKYGDEIGWSGFCGGLENYSYWIVKEDLLELLKRLGYKKIQISFDTVTHQNGPAFCVFAEK